VNFGPDAGIKDFDTEFHLRWFDHYLKGRETGVEKQAPVRVFVMGRGDGHRDADGRLFHGGYWRDASQWPPAEAKSVSYYLRANGSLSTAAPGGKERPATTYTFDLAHPVPTIGGGVSKRLKDGAFDQRERADFPGSRAPYLPLRARADVLVFETEPLTEDVDVMGPVRVELFAASTAVDTDFTAKLIDVYPNSKDFPQGFEMNLTDAILRASYRGGAKERVLMKPGEVYPLTIRPFDTANHFKKGHRIRVDISSSNFPRFDVNPGTGESLGLNRRAVKADNSVYHSGRYASRVVLMVVGAR
jgi:putative CocE/NonD family hydrolase